MKFLLPLIALTFFLTACNSNTAPSVEPAPKGVSVTGLQLGTDYDDKKIVIGEGELKGNLAVITYFGLN